MAPPTKNQLFVGSFIYSKTLDKLEYLHATAVFVDNDGKIVAVKSECDAEEAIATVLPQLGWDAADVHVTTCQEGQFFFPGFIGESPPQVETGSAMTDGATDTHLHASQYPNVGIFGNSTLLDWLNTYTFPMEASMADLAKARRVYSRVVRKTLAHGTTCVAYFASIDVAATNLLADLCLAAGQRALVGRVCMDQLSPPWYRDESPAAALAAARACIAHIERIDPPGPAALVRPVITPRFAPSCSGDLMRRLGALAAETGLPVQTHVSETAAELALVRELFPPGRTGARDDSYTALYDAFGLLTDRTVLAHAVHLSEAEAGLVAARGSKVSHCPCSNTAITSGAARVRWLLERGITCGLGTDMSGGYSPSVLEAARQAALVSRHVAMGGDERAKLTVEEVLYLATRGGADTVGLGGRVGTFELGMEWDAQLIGLTYVGLDGGPEDGADAEEGNVDIFGWETWEERIAKWLYNGDDRNTKKVWVKGRLVHERA